MSLTITTETLALSANAPNFAQLQASGATGSVRWSLLDGAALPPGLLLSADGRLTGNPNLSGTFTVTVTATDLGALGSATGGTAQSTPVTPAVSGSIALTLS